MDCRSVWPPEKGLGEIAARYRSFQQSRELLSCPEPQPYVSDAQALVRRVGSLDVRPTEIAGVITVDTERREDPRGWFARIFCERELGGILGERRIVQINHSSTPTVGAVRGMHYQSPPHAEMKLVRCLKGRVFDVAVDLRAGSQTMRKWHAEELSAANGRMVVIPEGCAHGFQVLEPDAELLYLHTAFYMPAAEEGVRPDDPAIAIAWPLPLRDLSARDRGHPLLVANYAGIVL